jgi:hypothetical protein
MIDFFQNTANIGNNSVNNFFDNTFIPASISAINSTQEAINRPKIYDYMILKPDIMDRGMPFNDFQISAPLVAQYDTIQTVKAPDDIPSLNSFNNTMVFQPMEYTRPKTLAQLMNIPASKIEPQIITDYIPPPPPPPNIIDNYTPAPIIDNSNITNNLKTVIPTLTTSLQNLNNDITQQQFNTNKTLQSSDVITSFPTILQSSNITPVLQNSNSNVNLSSQTIQIDFKNSLIVADQLQKNIIDNNKNETEKQFNLLNSNINKLVEMNADMNTNLINYKIANNSLQSSRSNNNFTDFTPQQQTNNNNIAFLLFIPILSILLKNV